MHQIAEDLLEKKADVPTVWHSDGLLDYSCVRSRLPVLEESVTQIGRGESKPEVAVVSANDVTLIRLKYEILSIGVTVMNPAFIGFLSLVPKSEEVRINGQAARPSALYLPAAQEGFHIRGAERDVIGVTLRRDRLIKTVAALQGIDPEDVSLNEPVLELGPASAARWRSQLAEILSRSLGTRAAPRSAQDVANGVSGLIFDAYLHARRYAATRVRRSQPPERIVRRAEERFLEAQGGPVSLADLCAAAGVSKTALYNAFHDICGEPPLSYFHKRRLMQARTSLMHSDSGPAPVKRAALAAGLTELGRFAVEYRHLFGESPSITLNRALS